MPRHFSHQRWNFGPEPLEARQMLSGDITAFVQAGVLYIQGDSDANFLSISATANPHELVISPRDNFTTINGVAGPATIAGVTAGTHITLGNGNLDWLSLDTTNRPLHFDGDLVINVQDTIGTPFLLDVVGNNTITIAGDLNIASDGDALHEYYLFSNVHISGDLNFSVEPDATHSLWAEFAFRGGSVGGDVRIDTHERIYIYLTTYIDGDVTLNGAASECYYNIESSIGGSLSANVRGSILDIYTSQIGGDLIFEGSGRFTVRTSTIERHVLMELVGFEFGSEVYFFGSDGATHFSHVGGNFVVAMDGDQTLVFLGYLNVEHDLVLRGGGGSDDVRVINVRTGNSLLIDSGGGNDIVWMHNSSVDGEAAILAGAGNDYLGMVNFLAARSLFVDTAAGFDLVTVSYASASQKLQFWLGSDSDQATLYGTRAPHISVDAGSGYDSVAIQYSAADHLFATLGEGNDSLAVIGSISRVNALFDGGPERDAVSLKGNLLTGLKRQRFEFLGA